MKSNRTVIIIAGAALALLTACGSTGESQSGARAGGEPSARSISATEAKGGKLRTTSDLQAYYTEPRKRRWETVSGVKGVSEITPDGMVKVDWGDGDDVGKWTIEDDAFCTTYKKVREGKKRCFRTYLMPDGSHRNYDAKTSKYVGTSWSLS